ncbi:MAG: hypothetical protein M3R08_04240 [Bacteroidota bacterium]|nr:hypothetical protein [Bacteroidota bacterium]
MDFLLTLGIAFIAGIILYYIDLNKGRRWNTGWYNLTHQHKSPGLVPKGLIHLQPFTRKLFMAIVISGLFTTIAILAGGEHAIMDLIFGGIGVVGLMLGFYAAVLIFKKQWNMDPVREVLNKVDQMEARAHGHEMPSPGAEPVQRPAKADPPSERRQEAPPAQQEKPDWRAGVKKYTDKK